MSTAGARTAAPETVHAALRRSAQAFGDQDFLCVLPDTARRYRIEPRTYSYSGMLHEVEALAGRYRACGYGHGHRAGLMLENRPDFFLHWLALNALGVSVVPIHYEWRSAELEYLVGHSEIAVAVVPAARTGELERAGRAAGRALCVSTPDLEALRAPSSPGPATGTVPGRDSECALLYTSGTTGRPKGCVLSNEYFLVCGEWYGSMGGACAVRPGLERLLTPLPMSHMNAMACSTMGMLMSGGCVVPLDRFHPDSWWACVRDARASIVHYLGVMPAILLGAPPAPIEREHSVRFGFGAGVSPRLHGAFETRFGFPLIEAWAMTETGSGAVVVANQEPRKVGSACFGRPQARVECRIVNEAGVECAPEEPGELLVRAAGTDPRRGFFREYLKDPQATAQAWAGGWFHTGDIVRRDAEGDLHFVDRKKNVIRRSGENISAVEVEGVLLQHPAVLSAGVAAVPDEIRGDEVMACIVPRAPLAEGERGGLAEELVAFCLQRLAYFKAPGYVVFCQALPLTATEKVQRAELKRLAASCLGTPGCIDLRARKKHVAA